MDNNIELVCTCCAENRKNSWQAANSVLDVKEGDFVKLGLKETRGTDEVIEHIWVQVTKIMLPKQVNGGNIRYTGKLDNVPVILTGYNLNDTVHFSFTDIEDKYND